MLQIDDSMCLLLQELRPHQRRMLGSFTLHDVSMFCARMCAEPNEPGRLLLMVETVKRLAPFSCCDCLTVTSKRDAGGVGFSQAISRLCLLRQLQLVLASQLARRRCS